MLRRSLIPAFLFVSLSLSFASLSAHHSRAMFDSDNPMELTGTVVEWQFTNPHVFIILEVADEAGNSEEWTLEGRGPNTIYREGWTPESLHPGDRITVTVSPLFSGAKGGSYSNVRREDGTLIDPGAARAE